MGATVRKAEADRQGEQVGRPADEAVLDDI